ncbi:hypothetical protein [Leptospira licerasiae]|uniref:Uncharacterized protein n=1 Tax=Leptospira licerasiae str. MMD4847 TaxID=1049971 RepID=A0ABN0HEN1_9LEPT|nr:hypothetical protein [Leptospira licerasiae]EIE01092.1 hypothetical protein LEP1GSC185_3871 [Leptospira licerasiae serovar Varillal str. VAR 010]EJZ44030.1 hypothetical protein LEP1GSC178_2020 [Leptospira licerasiae str. MMD4847]
MNSDFSEEERFARLQNLNLFLEERQKSSLLDRIRRLFLILTFTLMLLTLFFFFSDEGRKNFIKKSELHDSITKSIANEGDLRAIRNIYENRKLQTKSIYKVFNQNDEYYSGDVSLSKILEDIRTSLFITKVDNVSVSKIDRLIREHSERNPFDALEANQKDIFENLRMKSANNYSYIKTDVDKLASEIETKNALVNKYLNLSNNSFWVSIFALFISVVIGIYQIYQNRSSRLKLFLSTVLSQWYENIDSKALKSDKKSS